jgi:hypothetical protein
MNINPFEADLEFLKVRKGGKAQLVQVERIYKRKRESTYVIATLLTALATAALLYYFS